MNSFQSELPHRQRNLLHIASLLCITMLATLAVGAMAQETTTTSVKPKQTTKSMTIDNATVLYATGDDIVVKGADGSIKLFTLPPGSKLTVDGNEVAVSDLKPNTVIAHAVTKTIHEEEVTTVTVVEGTVTHVMAPLYVTLQFDDHSVKRYKVPPHAKFVIDGKDRTVFDLRKGMKISATAVVTNEHNIHSTEHTLAGGAGVETPAQVGVLLVYDHTEK